MVLQGAENKGVEFTVHVCKGSGVMECGRETSKENQNPHPLVKQTPKGCGTQDLLIALMVLHPP